jgi:tRNA G18 (ribose-2'-O)-methylase SpoU
MSKEKVTTMPNLIDSSPVHKAAVAAGDAHFRAWEYNVADHLKSKTVEEIRQYLKDTSNPFAVCAEHVIGDFNLGTLVRNANAFNAKEVFYIGNKKWDHRSAVGVHNYTEVKWLASLDELIKLQERYVFVGIDCVPGAVSLHSYNIPANPLFIFGEEGVGLTPIVQKMCKDVVYIPQFGSVRSINVGTASGIIMHEFVKRYLAAKVTY